MKKTGISILGIMALFVVSLSANAANYVPKIITGVVKADSWTMGNNKEGIYQLEVKEDGQLTMLVDKADPYMAPLGGAVYQDGTMHGIHFKAEWDPYEQAQTYTIYNVAYDMQTWNRTKELALSNMYGNLISSSGITHDPVTGLNYGIFYNFNMNYEVINLKLATIDFINTEASGAPKKNIIGIVDTPFAAIAAAENGFLYGVGRDGYLYIIDKVLTDEAIELGSTTVNVLPIGDLGIEDISTNPSSMTFDPRTKKLYWSYVSTKNKSYLYEINYNIGQVKATKLMQIPDNAYLVNMYIAPMEAADDAPAAVSDLQLSFEGEQTTGIVAFTMPTKTYSGDDLSGELTYSIYVDDSVLVATSTAQAGAQVAKVVSVPSEGRIVEVKVVAKNAAGEGAAKTAKLYIGRDTPLAVTNLKLNYNMDTEFMRLSWDAPVEGINGKPLTQANLSYDVIRYPDSVVVAHDLKLIGFSEKIEKTANLKSYFYGVVTVNGKHVGDTAVSNKVVVGQALVPPFDEDFTTQQGFDRFTVIDSDNDGVKPKYSDWQNIWVRYHKVYTYTSTVADHAMIYSKNASNDYLLTPPLQLEKGGSYELKFTARKGYSGAKYDQRMRVLVGLAGEDLADYEVVKDSFDITDVNLEEFMADINIKADGIYQIAFHAISKAESGELYLDEIHLASSLSSYAPKAVTDIVATADAQGYLKATVKFTAPTETLHGDPLTAISRIVVIDTDDIVCGRIDNPTPGQECTILAENMKNGINTYYVVAYAGDDAGAKAPFSLFIGQDYPTEPTEVALTDNGTEAVLTWKAPEKGYNGLVLNPELLTYNLYTISADGYPTLVKKNIKSPYNTGVKTAEGDQQLLYYAIDAQNTAGLSELVPTNSLVIGEPYTLPYVDHFDKTNQKFVWLEGDYPDWNMGLAKLSDDDFSQDYAMAFEPNRADYGFYNLGKMTLAGVEKPVLAFRYLAQKANDIATLGVAVESNQDSKAKVVAQIDFQNETSTTWKKVKVDLSEFKSSDYIIVKFAMVSKMDAAEKFVICFDDLYICEEEMLLGIDDTFASSVQNARQRGVYRLDGTRVDDTQKLQKGIYIIDGRKTVVK